MWGGFWLPLRWFDTQGVGGGWVSLVFNAVAALSALPWLARRNAWNGFASQALTGLLLGSAFSLYTISLVLTDVLHAILLFYLTPVWSTLAGWVLFRERMNVSRLAAIALGFTGMTFILGVSGGLPLPRNAGDWISLGSGMLWFLAWAYLRVRRIEGMGGGDIKIAAMFGAVLGWERTLLTLFVSAVGGSIWGISMIARGQGGGKTPIPFGCSSSITS